MNCIWCDADIIPQVNWGNLFVLEKPKLLCPVCEGKLDKIEGKRCVRCSRRSADKVCSDCQWWEEKEGERIIEFNYSIFSYNEMMKDMIAKWKYRGDYYVGEAFKHSFITAYHEKFAFLKKNAVVVPIPLSTRRLKERAFNQAKMLADFLPVETIEALCRTHGEKQSKKSRMERIYADNPFFIEESINKSVILVDDIYTTGTTLRHAAKLLRDHHCPEIYALTLVRG
ncbi:ComF family protein [Oceanobacillus halophilus]|uniref:ComF family protein n=1 Tax=Oceanobacillus halophilus TaxID=930130 RepID=A0A495A6W9_9BACI|nr:ComF family protein [Oceanobacillus halophilus]RKQ35582.1 ComF family protein [Oceanobacillus halophilus]